MTPRHDKHSGLFFICLCTSQTSHEHHCTSFKEPDLFQRQISEASYRQTETCAVGALRHTHLVNRIRSLTARLWTAYKKLTGWFKGNIECMWVAGTTCPAVHQGFRRNCMWSGISGKIHCPRADRQLLMLKICSCGVLNRITWVSVSSLCRQW